VYVVRKKPAVVLRTTRNVDVLETIDKLPEREKLLMSLYYERGMNLREIGAVMEVSESRVCQLHSQAVARLRARLREMAWASVE